MYRIKAGVRESRAYSVCCVFRRRVPQTCSCRRWSTQPPRAGYGAAVISWHHRWGSPWTGWRQFMGCLGIWSTLDS
ncbi:hypothetical protein BDW60DRAFT_199453 [Aspergillus nidulans var. acristatus]